MSEAEDINIRSELIELQGREPFVPFTIVMTSGDRYEVVQDDAIVVGREVIVVAPAQRRGHSTLQFFQISSVEAYERT